MENYLYQLTKRIIYNFRENDILNGGEGAPLTPIFHQLIATEKKLNFLSVFLILEEYQMLQ